MLKDLPIRVKLPLILVSTCALALFLAGAAFVVNARRDAKNNLIDETTVLAEVIANRSNAALVFEDRRLARENLEVFALHDQIDKACIFLGKDHIFAAYSREKAQGPFPNLPEDGYSYQFGEDYLHVFQPIELENKRLGYVYVRAQLRQYRAEQRQQLIIAIVILTVAALVAYLFSSRLLKGITKPLGVLANMATNVAEKNDYSIRMQSPENHDEMACLINAFNEMLAQIENRDKALQDSEKRFRSLVEQAVDAFFLHDQEGNVLDVNHQACLSLGYSREELIGMNVSDIDVEVSPKKHKERFWKNLSPEQPITFEGLHCRKDGTIFPVEIRLGVLILEGQAYLTSLARDITDRKHAEEELNRLRALLNNIIDSMPSILVSVDTGGLVTQWNMAATKSTGIPADKAIGHSLAEVYPRLVDEMDRVRQSITDRKILAGKRIATHVEDNLCLEDVTIYPLIANGIDGAVILIDDVTNKVRLEEMMIQTEKMMSVGGLAAGMAHEINNPLGVMMHASQNIERRFSPDLPANIKVAQKLGLTMADLTKYVEERRILETIREIRLAGERAANIVANMLQFSRRSESLHQSFDLTELIDTALELANNDYDLKKKFDFRQIEIVREYHPEVPKVPVIATEFEQVILNILKNGAQAMAEKANSEKSRLIIRVLPDHRMVRIEIEDNGPGMTEAVSKRVFEPFFTTKPVGLGTGLGLAVSFMIIVNNHKGTMEVESAPGQGAKFIIRLPIKVERVKA